MTAPRYSQGGPPRQAGRGGRAPAFRMPSVKGFLLFALPAPLLLSAIIALGSGSLSTVLADGSAFALFMFGALLTRRELIAVNTRPERRYGSRPRLSRRRLGAGLITVATGMTAFLGAGHGLAISIAFAAVALLAFHLLYGLDDGLSAPVPFAGASGGEAVTDALAEAEQRILNIEQAAGRIGNRELRTRLERIGVQGRTILGMIERRPTDLRRARKFLTVYLEGAEQVTNGYADTHQLADSHELEQNFRTVLVTIEDVFAEQQQKLLDTDVMDLDVQIEVLTKQLKHEGIL